MKDAILQLLIDFKTPLDRGKKDLETFLETRYDSYLKTLQDCCDPAHNPTLGKETCDMIVAKIPTIENLCKAIVDTVQAYDSGNVTGGQRTFFKALDGIKDDLSIQYVGAHKNVIYYRIRKREHESDFKLERKELFHIPYDKRNAASSERFSIAGYPCLYLSSQYEICWYECNKPDSFALAAFYVPQTIDDTIKLIDIGEAMTPLAHNFYCWFCNERNNDLELKEIGMYLVKQLVTYPLRMACSIIVSDPNSENKPEYIIPQMLMQWLMKDNEFNGVRYETMVCAPEMRLAGAITWL